MKILKIVEILQISKTDRQEPQPFLKIMILASQNLEIVLQNCSRFELLFAAYLDSLA